MDITPAYAVALNDAALDATRALSRTLGVYDYDTNDANVVVRADLGMILVYQSTRTHAFEARANGHGAYYFRINCDTFNSAADIPTTFRKFLPVARAIERADALTREALTSTRRADLARIAANEYRDDATRAEARAALADMAA